MNKKVSEIGLENEKFDYAKTQSGSKTYQDIMDKLDELDEANDRLVKTSRLRGFTEGCLTTLGVVAIGSLIIQTINKD